MFVYRPSRKKACVQRVVPKRVRGEPFQYAVTLRNSYAFPVTLVNLLLNGISLATTGRTVVIPARSTLKVPLTATYRCPPTALLTPHLLTYTFLNLHCVHDLRATLPPKSLQPLQVLPSLPRLSLAFTRSNPLLLAGEFFHTSLLVTYLHPLSASSSTSTRAPPITFLSLSHESDFDDGYKDNEDRVDEDQDGQRGVGGGPANSVKDPFSAWRYSTVKKNIIVNEQGTAVHNFIHMINMGAV